jgi:hypothetical protein
MNPAKANSFYQRSAAAALLNTRDIEAETYGDADRAQAKRLPENVRLKVLKILTLTLLHELEAVGTARETTVQGFNLQTEVRHFEAELIRSALIMTGGRQRRAAKLLGMKVTTLHTKIRRYGLDVAAMTPEPGRESDDEPNAKQALRTSLELVDSIFESDDSEVTPEIHLTGSN